IDIHYTNDKLVAATFGRGLWEISIKNSTLSTDNFNEDKDLLSIFPNPTTNGILNINIKNAYDYNYSIYNVVGGVDKSGKLDSSTIIDVSNLA
ncbi:T9SS type A sorting domain-containing protein, partial [Tenacibaculum halocynthiae]|uniref:T9SS type A sorting domain-containing protein n=1 Tax=Tenacibaculum halocynthiae TaxID=1254437 RepID=UPI003D65219F